MSDPQPNASSFQAPEPADLAPLFPGYDIEYLIATGGMGAVYRAVQRSLDRTVAIKILPKEFSADAAFCAGFEAEAKAMARLNHTNLIGVYDFGEVNGMLFIIMELVPGQSLFHSSHGLAIDPSEVIRIITGICHGLAHAHESGIIHRDIKPSNILLDLNAQPKIGDFGLARPVEIKTQEGEEIFGTPHYTAPEVVNAPHSVDNRADIFSLGVMLHELLTGRLPADDPRPASAISHCDPRFDAIIRRATNPIPEERYTTATEIAHELQHISTTAGPRVLRTTPPKVHAPTLPRHRRHPSSTNSSSGIPTIFFLIVAVIVAASAYYFLSKNNTPTQTLETPVPNTTAAPAIPEPSTPPEPAPNAQHAPEHLPEVTPVTPLPTPEKDPEPTASQPAASLPQPEKETATLLPKFDTSEFFNRARKIMTERAAPLIATHDENLKKNLTLFEREAKRVIRKIEYRDSRLKADDAIDDFLTDCTEDGNRIPVKLPQRLRSFQDMDELHEESYENQQSIDTTLIDSLSQLSSTYTLGLEKQIERLKSTDDPAAIKIIEKEIKNTRTDEDYFPSLMLDTDQLELLKPQAEDNDFKNSGNY